MIGKTCCLCSYKNASLNCTCTFKDIAFRIKLQLGNIKYRWVEKSSVFPMNHSVCFSSCTLQYMYTHTHTPIYACMYEWDRVDSSTVLVIQSFHCDCLWGGFSSSPSGIIHLFWWGRILRASFAFIFGSFPFRSMARHTYTKAALIKLLMWHVQAFHAVDVCTQHHYFLHMCTVYVHVYKNHILVWIYFLYA